MKLKDLFKIPTHTNTVEYYPIQSLLQEKYDSTSEKDIVISFLKEHGQEQRIPKYEKIIDRINGNDNKIIGIGKNKESDYLILFMFREIESINLFMDSPNYIGKRPLLYASYSDDTKTQISIKDIQAAVDGIGNGSVLIKCLLSIAKDKGVNKITGWLSWVDSGHFDILKRFYSNNGFKVSFNEDKSEGWISLEL